MMHIYKRDLHATREIRRLCSCTKLMQNHLAFLAYLTSITSQQDSQLQYVHARHDTLSTKQWGARVAHSTE